VLGSDVSGVFEAVGERVTDLVPFDDVFVSARGTFADYVVAPRRSCIKCPLGLGFN